MSGVAKNIKGDTFTSLQRTPLLDNFDYLVAWCFGLASWTLNPERETWQNYASSLGIAATRTAASIATLVQSGNTQGVPTLVREVYELATRFVDCIEHQNDAWAAGIQKEINQLLVIQKTQTTVIHTVDVAPFLQDRQALLQTILDSSDRGPAEPETGKNLGVGGRERYQLLCLGAHNRPGALLSKYNNHFFEDRLDPFQAEQIEHVEEYLRMTAYALGVAIDKYLRSELFPANDRDHHLSELGKLTAPFIA